MSYQDIGFSLQQLALNRQAPQHNEEPQEGAQQSSQGQDQASQQQQVEQEEGRSHASSQRSRMSKYRDNQDSEECSIGSFRYKKRGSNNSNNNNHNNNKNSQFCARCEQRRDLYERQKVELYYGGSPEQRVQGLKQQIRQLEKALEKERRAQTYRQLAEGEYFHNMRQPQPQMYRKVVVPAPNPKKMEEEFASMCVDMVSKLTRIASPSLKYCWKFIKTNIGNLVKGSCCTQQEIERAQSKSREKPKVVHGLVVDFPKSNKIKRKVELILNQLKETLRAQKNQELPQLARKLVQENQVLRKVYQKVQQLFNLKVTHPYMLAYYLDDYIEKLGTPHKK